MSHKSSPTEWLTRPSTRGRIEAHPEDVTWSRIDAEWSELVQKNRYNPYTVDDLQIQSVLYKIKLCPQLPDFPISKPPVYTREMTMATKMHTIQSYIESFQYNFTGISYFNLKKDRPYQRLMETAKEMIRDCLPIKCLEAVFLGLYLTSEFKEIERYPLSFKSKVDNSIYRHIVLVVRNNGKYGSIGLSRKTTLSYKPLRYDTLGDLVLDFIHSYEDCWHKVLEIRVGLPPTHNTTSTTTVYWKFFTLDVRDHSSNFIREAFSTFTRVSCSIPGDADSKTLQMIQSYQKNLEDAIGKLEVQYGEVSKRRLNSRGGGRINITGNDSGFSSGFDDDYDDSSDSETEFTIKNQRLRNIKELNRPRNGKSPSSTSAGRPRPTFLAV